MLVGANIVSSLFSVGVIYICLHIRIGNEVTVVMILSISAI